MADFAVAIRGAASDEIRAEAKEGVVFLLRQCRVVEGHVAAVAESCVPCRRLPTCAAHYTLYFIPAPPHLRGTIASEASPLARLRANVPGEEEGGYIIKVTL